MIRPIAFMVVCCSLVAGAPPQPTTSFVHASRAALRAHPSSTAPVIGYLTTNSEVRLHRQDGEWCEVSTAGGRTAGYLACGLIADLPIAKDFIQQRLSAPDLSASERLDWQARLFWVSPSLTAFAAVGLAMEEALLSKKQKHDEFMIGEASRRHNPEFDAMKARMEEGIVATGPVFSGRPAEDFEPLARAMRRSALPGVGPSFFPAGQTLVATPLRPFTLGDIGEVFAATFADALSANAQASFRAGVAQPLLYAHFGAIGVWDVSAMRVTFDREVTIRAVTANGSQTGMAVRSLVAPVGNHGCGGGGMDVTGRPLNISWSSAIVAWVGRTPTGKATVTTSQLTGPGQYDKIVIENIDLDNDGILDFSLWSGVDPPVVGTETHWKSVLGNVGGKWLLLGASQEADCT